MNKFVICLLVILATAFTASAETDIEYKRSNAMSPYEFINLEVRRLKEFA